MSLNRIHIKAITVCTLLLMMWDTFGWFGSNLLFKHSHAEKGEHHCVVSFCTCKTDSENSICTCHHPELQENNSNAPDDGVREATDDKAGREMCFYSKSHPKENKPSIIVVWTEYQALINADKIDFGTRQQKRRFNQIHNTVTEGFMPEIFEPPQA